MRRFTTTIPVRSQETIYYTINVDACSQQEAAQKLRDLHAKRELIPFLSSEEDIVKHDLRVIEIDRIEGGDMWITPKDFELTFEDTTPDLY